MKFLQKIEQLLEKLFKNAPNLSPTTLKLLVIVMPWLVFLFGIVQLAGAFVMWHVLRSGERAQDFVNSFSQYYEGYTLGPSAFDWAVAYVGIGILILNAVVLLVAFRELLRRRRRGWELLLLSLALNVTYGVLSIFMYGQGIGTFFMSVLGAATGLYLLFQVRDKYNLN